MTGTCSDCTKPSFNSPFPVGFPAVFLPAPVVELHYLLKYLVQFN